MSDTDYAYDAEDEDYAYDGGRVLWGRVLFWLVALLIMFALGRAFAPSGTPDADVLRLQSQVTELASENAELEAQLRAQEAGGAQDEATEAPEATDTSDEAADAAEGEEEADAAEEPAEEAAGSANTETYTVVNGDTLRGIALRVYGDPEQASRIIEENGLDRDAPLRVGQELRIPRD